MDFLKTIGGKIASGAVALAVIAGGISWWRMEESTRHALLTGTGRIAAWLGLVLVLPWASFFVIGRAARLESNLAGGALVAAYTVVEAALLAWLFGWAIHGATAVVFFGAAVLFAGAYNLLACDWIAEKIE
jgi:FtsH-binding integral membrane protein